MHAQKCSNGNARAGRVCKSDHVPDARAGLSSGNIYWAKPQLKRPGEDHLCAVSFNPEMMIRRLLNQALADRHPLHELGLRSSVPGQKRHFDFAAVTSGLPPILLQNSSGLDCGASF
jgi:hypothetical protein